MTDHPAVALAALRRAPKTLEEDRPLTIDTWGESDRDFIIQASHGITWKITPSLTPPEIYRRWPETLRPIDLPQVHATLGRSAASIDFSRHIPNGLIALYRAPLHDPEKLVGIAVLNDHNGTIVKTLYQKIGDRLIEVRNQPIDGYSTFGQSPRSKSDWKRPILSWTGIGIVLASFTHMTMNDLPLEQIYIFSLAALLAVIIWAGTIFISGKLSVRRALRIFIWPAITASLYIGLRFFVLWLSNLN
jgi:hypothetical protein